MGQDRRRADRDAARPRHRRAAATRGRHGAADRPAHRHLHLRQPAAVPGLTPRRGLHRGLVRARHRAGHPRAPALRPRSPSVRADEPAHQRADRADPPGRAPARSRPARRSWRTRDRRRTPARGRCRSCSRRASRLSRSRSPTPATPMTSTTSRACSRAGTSPGRWRSGCRSPGRAGCARRGRAPAARSRSRCAGRSEEDVQSVAVHPDVDPGVFEQVLPALKADGVTDEQWSTLLVENPRRWLSPAAPVDPAPAARVERGGRRSRDDVPTDPRVDGGRDARRRARSAVAAPGTTRRRTRPRPPPHDRDRRDRRRGRLPRRPARQLAAHDARPRLGRGRQLPDRPVARRRRPARRGERLSPGHRRRGLHHAVRGEGPAATIDSVPICPSQTGRYTWRASEGAFTLRVVDDPCKARAALFGGRWTSSAAGR